MDAGAETSASFLQAFVLALLSYPECQKKIQIEIDTVIGSTRMPNLADFEELPYLQAFINEVSVYNNLQFLLSSEISPPKIDSSFQTSFACRPAAYGDWKYNCALAGLFFSMVILIPHRSTRAMSSQRALCSLWIYVCEQSFHPLTLIFNAHCRGYHAWPWSVKSQWKLFFYLGVSWRFPRLFWRTGDLPTRAFPRE